MAALLFVLACGDGAAAAAVVRTGVALPERSVFIALEHDFAGFRDWHTMDVAGVKAQGTTHPAGNCRLFVNALPAAGRKRFAVGTMIVKQVEATKDDRAHLFAMAKRGGGFNAKGAADWEWFELGERPDGSAGIMWRGLGAPRGEEYGGDPLGTCNNCHSMAFENDYVKSDALQLAAVHTR